MKLSNKDKKERNKQVQAECGQLPDYAQGMLASRARLYSEPAYTKEQLIAAATVPDSNAAELVKYMLHLRKRVDNRKSWAEFVKCAAAGGGKKWWRSFCSSLWLIYRTEPWQATYLCI